MKIERKKIRKRIYGVLIILALIFGYFIGRSDLKLFITDLHAQETTPVENKAVSAKHGYSMYLNFEYEIVTNSYGNFVVVKDRDHGTLTTAGLN